VSGVNEQAAMVAALSKRITALERAASIRHPDIPSALPVPIAEGGTGETALKGWHPIGSGDESSLTITVPSGVARVRLSWQGSNSVSGYLRARINNDTTAGLHIRSTSLITPSGSHSHTVATGPADVFTDVRDGDTDTTFALGSFNGTLLTWGKAEFDLTSGNVPYFSESYRQGIPGGTRRFLGWGNLAATRTVTSIVLSINTGSLSALEWRAEGYYD